MGQIKLRFPVLFFRCLRSYSFNLIKNGFFESTFSAVISHLYCPRFSIYQHYLLVFPSKNNNQDFSLRIFTAIDFYFICTFPVVSFFVFMQPAVVFLTSWAYNFVITPVLAGVQEQRDKNCS